jgi:hypothetical protein
MALLGSQVKPMVRAYLQNSNLLSVNVGFRSSLINVVMLEDYKDKQRATVYVISVRKSLTEQNYFDRNFYFRMELATCSAVVKLAIIF